MEANYESHALRAQQDLADLLSLLTDGLLEATDSAVQYFERQNRDTFEPWLYSHITRDQLLLRLEREDIKALGFAVKRQALSGVYLCSPEYELRVLRPESYERPEGSELSKMLPRSRHSRLRRDYYEQRQLFDKGEDSGDDAEQSAVSRVKLVALWEVDGEHQLSSIQLSCPTGTDEEGYPLAAYWTLPIYSNDDDVEEPDKDAPAGTSLEDVPLPGETDSATEIASGG